ncbi:MAG TPA: carboxymuconolactone decarboxylase family protein [Terracidiphilus sp.]|nr:carboxymuconolactone decarboxylase family protein [Terracidiphilus sp.]HEV2397988.1 carboxymuconolactone decarboxylase family protein [Candidatus Sulfotelmatobacter sp.]
MNSDQMPTVEQVFGMMRKAMGSVPPAIEKAAAVDEGLLYEHLRSRAYAMPAEGGLDEEARTLIYLAAALAGSSRACIQAMANKAKVQGIAAEKVMETVRIVRLALATKVIGDAESIFEVLQGV